jgi:polysaccharide deacetylase family protein (PEP-CTERM system associated)
MTMKLLGIDFEDWYHPQIIQKYLDDKKKIPRVIDGLDKIIDLLRVNDTFATFFMVGELIEFRPEIIDKIINSGHEIAFHTMHHTRLDAPNFKSNFDSELKQFKKLTEGKSKGFRAPTFSLNYDSSWAIDTLIQNGYTYDSSIMPTKTGMYGIDGADKIPYKISSSCINKNDPDGKLVEFPLLVTKFFGKTIPASGGFYLRFLPLNIIKNAIEDYEKKSIPATFYIHSWELTPEFMPKISMSFKDKFITYHNVEKTFSKMENLLKKFQFTSFNRFMGNMKLN